MTADNKWRWWSRCARMGRLAVLAILAWAVGLPDLPPLAEAVATPEIEIVIRNASFVRTKTQPVRAGVPVALVIRNEDVTRHGFVSPLFTGRSVRVEQDGVATFGTGIEGVHLDPGKTVVIRLTPDRQGKVTFRCDLHPDVQGEMYLLDVPVG